MIIPLIVVLVILVFYKFVFLRDPDRRILSGNNLVAPADGKIISIMKIGGRGVKIKKGLVGRIDSLCSDVTNEGYVISIFMSIFNVHVNRAPISGKVVSVRHKKGKFFMAYDVKKSFYNEKNEIIIETKIGKIKIIQIAGFLARRIECFVNGNQKINKGQKIGRIIMGSQVSLILPNIKLKIKEGDYVKAGETVLAEY